MAGKRKKASTARQRLSASSSRSRAKYDLDVPLILAKHQGSETEVAIAASAKNNDAKNRTKRTKARPTIWRGTNKEQMALVQRLAATGYSTIALSHEIHGGDGVQEGVDDAHITIPDSLVKIHNSSSNSNSNSNSNKKRKMVKEQERTGTGSKEQPSEKPMPQPQSSQSKSPPNIKILRRLNIIIEQESDLALYSPTSISEAAQTILSSYDLIALSPRNETVLSAICNSSSLTLFGDIIILDYTAGRGGVQLPFGLKHTYVSAATKNGWTWELPYGPALIDASKRKAFVRSSMQMMTASVGVLKPRKPAVVISSGGRVLDGRDYGAMVLRSAGDIMNFARVVLGFEDRWVSKCTGEFAKEVVERGRNRKLGKVGSGLGSCEVTFHATLGEADDEEDDSPYEEDGDGGKDEKGPNAMDVDQNSNTASATIGKENDDDEDDDGDDGDGFLRL